MMYHKKKIYLIDTQDAVYGNIAYDLASLIDDVRFKTSEELKNKILGNMSERVRTYITEEMEFLGPMRVSEVEEVQLRIVQQVRQLEEQGQITVVRGDSDDQFV